MKDDRPIASLSIDVDNRWAYLRAAGRADWKSATTYLPMVMDRVVDTLGAVGLPVTAFLVGRDLVDETDIRAIESLSQLSRWEFGNHSLNHLPWMHTLSREQIHEEIRVPHDRLLNCLGYRPRGFRGPGFSCPPQVLAELADAEYAYDASIFPTSMAPIARAVFLARTRLKGAERERAKKLYGGFAAMRQPNVPFRRRVESMDTMLWETPVTVMPVFRTPIHFSYLIFLASFSVPLAKGYYRSALAMCRRCGVPPSLLLHPPDFLGVEDRSELDHLPGMKMRRESKLRFVSWALRVLAEQFDVVTIAAQIDRLNGTDNPLMPESSNTTPATACDVEERLAATGGKEVGVVSNA